MPTYTFELKEGSGGIKDTNGIVFDTEHEAYLYAHEVVHELMRGRERQTRTWRLEVYDDMELAFTIPFATLDHMPDELRASVEAASDHRSTSDLLHAAHDPVRPSQVPVARSRGKLYVAADRGRRIIREL